MELRVKRMGALKAQTPPNNQLTLPEGAAIDGNLQVLDLAGTHVQIVMVNSRSQVLGGDEELTILPPVGGG